MTNPYEAERRQRVTDVIRQYVPDVRPDDAVIEDVTALLGDEVRSAYGRGVRAGHRPQRTRQAAPRREQPLNSASALKNGKLRPVQQAGA